MKKETSNINATVPVGNVVSSNGILIGTDTMNGYVTYHWQETHPIATYLMCVATGTYSVISMSVPPIAGIRDTALPVHIYTLTADSATAASFFSFIPGIVQWFESHYGAYPMDKVGYELVPLGGGMEHQSMISLGEQFISDTASYRILRRTNFRINGGLDGNPDDFRATHG